MKRDNIIFDGLGLTEEERKEVYYATAQISPAKITRGKECMKGFNCK